MVSYTKEKQLGKKKPSLEKEKKKAWDAISLYVRTRDNFICFTCGKYGNQAGHMFPKALGLNAYFDIRNIHCQCYHCNINLGGNGAIYSKKFIDKYGQKEHDDLYKCVHSKKKYKVEDYIEMQKRYALD